MNEAAGRLGGMPIPVAFGLVALCTCGCACFVVMAIVFARDAWRGSWMGPLDAAGSLLFVGLACMFGGIAYALAVDVAVALGWQ